MSESADRKTTALLVKLTEAEKKLLDEAARRASLPTATWVRWLCLREARDSKGRKAS